MKQLITNEQFLELSEENRDKLLQAIGKDSYAAKNDVGGAYCRSHMWFTIGQMIEFLNEDIYLKIEKIHPGSHWQWFISKDNKNLGIIGMQENRYELCDSLWEAIKEVLEK